MKSRIMTAMVVMTFALSLGGWAGAGSETHMANRPVQPTLMDQIQNLLDHNQNKQAYELAKAGAEAGDAGAEFKLGHLFDLGVGANKDTRQAIAWYTKSAEQGYAEAQYALGYAYQMGDGVAEDRVKSFRWYEKSAKQGYADAIFSPALFYDNGVVVEQDQIKAATLLRLAAKKGYSGAQDYLDNHMSPFHASPTSRKESVSCKTNCVNGSCSRVYADGHRVQFQAQQKFNPLSGAWEWDPGTC